MFPELLYSHEQVIIAGAEYTTLPGMTIRNVVATGGACGCARGHAGDVDV